MDCERTRAIEHAFCALDGVSSADFYQQGEIEGVDLTEHPAVRLSLKKPRIAFYVFLAYEILNSASPGEIAAHYSGAVQHYLNQRAA